MKLSNILWGLVLILIGIIFGLNALDIADINIFFDGWWTLFIIVPCFIDLFKDRDKSGNIIGLIIGICLLLGCQNIIDFDLIWKLMLPFILIMIGLSFIFKDVFKNKNNKVVNKKGMKEYCATFGGQKVNYAKEKFEGCNLTAVFGGIECDLRDAIINGDVVINSSAIFGDMSDFMILNYCYKVDEFGYSIYPARNYSDILEEDYRLKVDESRKKISILEAENKILKQDLSITQDAVNELIFNSLNM